MTFGAVKFQVDVKNAGGGEGRNEYGPVHKWSMIQKGEKKLKRKKTILKNSGGNHDFKP